MKRQTRNHHRQEFVRAKLVEFGYDVWKRDNNWYCALRQDRFEKLIELVQHQIDNAIDCYSKSIAEQRMAYLEDYGKNHRVFATTMIGGDSFVVMTKWKTLAERIRKHGDSKLQFIVYENW